MTADTVRHAAACGCGNTAAAVAEDADAIEKVIEDARRLRDAMRVAAEAEARETNWAAWHSRLGGLRPRAERPLV